MKTWGEYYLKCKDVYPNTSNVSIYDLKLKVNPFPIDQIYFDQILSIKNQLDILYEDKSNYNNRHGLALGLNDIFIFKKEIQIIVDKYLIPYLEKNIFGCYVQCQNVKIYKTTSESLIETSSWLWHFDNNPKEQIKVMIYLNDVNNNGPFKYLLKDNEAIKIETSKKDHTSWVPGISSYFEFLGKRWKGTRVPRHIISNLQSKNEIIEKNLKGSAGTAILFDNNILHKGTIPFEGFRYAMTLQFQPINKKLNPNFSKENTGNGWSYDTFSKDPESPIIKK